MQQMIETHGQEETSPKKQPTSLEQVWGFDGMEKFGTSDEGQYNKRLEDMNRPELETHARMMGVVIVESSSRLKDKLMTEFRQHQSLLNKPASTAHPTIKVSEAAMKVLAEGK